MAALKGFIQQKQPTLVLMPHTYQVRDFAPATGHRAWAARSSATPLVFTRMMAASWCFTRQMFQGKFAADVSFACPAPHFVTFQARRFRGDKAEAGASRCSGGNRERQRLPMVLSAISRKHPFKEAKQAVDLTQAEIIVSVGRGIKEQKNIETGQGAGGRARRRDCRVASHLRLRLAAHGPPDRQLRADRFTQTVSCGRHRVGPFNTLCGMKGSRSIIAINKDAEGARSLRSPTSA